MTVEDFNKLSKEQQQEEIEKCKSFEYFYENYCWKEGMPKYTETAYKEYMENNMKQRFSRRRMRNSYSFPLTPEEAFKKK